LLLADGPAAAVLHELTTVRTRLSACAMGREVGGMPQKGTKRKRSHSSVAGSGGVLDV
jgi:hypothetical protein